MLTLDSPRIVETATYCKLGKWYLIVVYSEGEDDEYGPYDTKDQAERSIFG